MDEKQLLYVLIGIAAVNLIISLMSSAEGFRAGIKRVSPSATKPALKS